MKLGFAAVVVAAALAGFAGGTGADVRTLTEDCEGAGGTFNPRFTHVIEDLGGSFADWEITNQIVLGEDTYPLPSNMLKLRTAQDMITWDLTGVGNFINGASVDVQDLEGGFAGTSTARVIFHGEFGDISRRPHDTQQVYTISASRDDVVDFSDNGQVLGSVLSIELHGVWAYFDNMTLDVGHRHCPCDFNENGVFGVQDIYDFLSDWNAGEEGEHPDFNEDGEITVQDIYDFLQCWNDHTTWPLPQCQ